MYLFLGRRRLLRTLAVAGFLACVVLYYQYTSQRWGYFQHIITEDSFSYTLNNDDNTSSGFLPQPEVTTYCAAHNWKPYPTRDVRRKIYDLFMVNSELDWLEIRLNTLRQEVDYFVILEAAQTFTGIPKPLYVSENWKHFEEFHPQIIYRVLNDSELHSSRAWDHEDLQRNAMFDQVFPNLDGAQKPNLGDVILVSDIDEVPRPATLTVLRNCNYPRRLTLRSKFYYYSFQWLHRGNSGSWPHPQATTYDGMATIRPADLRNGEGGNLLMYPLEKADFWNSAWHCSSCFSTIDAMLNKMSSFSHQGWNQPEFRRKAGLVHRVRNGLDLFDREGQFYDKIVNNADVPDYLKHDTLKWKHLLDRDPINANFDDYSLIEAEIGANEEQDKK